MTNPATMTTPFGGDLLRGTQWHGRTFTGLRVAVIAPGREAAVIVPQVIRTARAVKVFQEEPDWLLPLPLPLPRALARPAARLNLRLRVRDPWTRRLLTPDARFNRHRPRIDRRYYAALQEPHCALIPWPVYALVPGGIRSAEGIEHHVDCIILGTTAAHREDLCA